MARFKVGQRVMADMRSPAVHTTVGGFSPGAHSMIRGVLTKDIGRRKWKLRSDSGDVYDVDESDLSIVYNSAKNSAARNAADTDRVKVICETETLFGTRREEKTMTVAELRAAFAKVGSIRLFNDVMRRFDEGKDANVLLHIPCETWIVKS